MAYEEEEASKDAAIRKAIKDVGTEVERTEGRGILKVGLMLAEQSMARLKEHLNPALRGICCGKDKNRSYGSRLPEALP